MVILANYTNHAVHKMANVWLPWKYKYFVNRWREIWYRQLYLDSSLVPYFVKGGRGRDCMVLGFTTIYAISAYHH